MIQAITKDCISQVVSSWVGSWRIWILIGQTCTLIAVFGIGLLRMIDYSHASRAPKNTNNLEVGDRDEEQRQSIEQSKFD